MAGVAEFDGVRHAYGLCFVRTPCAAEDADPTDPTDRADQAGESA